ncbi:MAG: FctA domain-containing protein, partial [Lachnospiraceae bacterium]|nr:FctA domain-containing protein [Lachnospiraceae bacterium]
MKTRVRYRLLALCMAVLLICPLISVSAFAEEGDASSDIQYENTENGAHTQDAESDAAEPDAADSLVVKIPVTKKIDYHPTGSTKVESTFTFQIAPGSDDAKAKLPEKTTLDITTDQEKTDYFEITFTEAGTYCYQVNEIAGTEKGFSYNNGYFRIWIEIVQDDAGNLVVDEENSFYGMPTDRYPLFTEEGLVFINHYYNCDPVTIKIPVEKKIVPAKEGGEMPKEDGTFTLTIEQMNSGADALDHSPEETSVVLKTASSDMGEFGPMTFYAAGIYVFSIKETAGSDSAYEYDETVHSIDVLVSFNEAQGVLQVDHVLDYHEGSPEGDPLFLSEGTDPIQDVTTLSVQFTNKYTASEDPKDESKDEDPKDESKVED